MGGVAAVLVAIVLWVAPAEVVHWKDPSKLKISPFFSLTVDVGAIAVGFLGTAKGILLSIQGSRTGQRMRALGLTRRLSSAIVRAIVCAFVLVGVSILGVLIETVLEIRSLSAVALPIWAFALFAAGSSSRLVISVLFDVLNEVAKTPPRKTQGDSAIEDSPYTGAANEEGATPQAPPAESR